MPPASCPRFSRRWAWSCCACDDRWSVPGRIPNSDLDEFSSAPARRSRGASAASLDGSLPRALAFGVVGSLGRFLGRPLMSSRLLPHADESAEVQSRNKCRADVLDASNATTDYGFLKEYSYEAACEPCGSTATQLLSSRVPKPMTHANDAATRRGGNASSSLG